MKNSFRIRKLSCFAIIFSLQSQPLTSHLHAQSNPRVHSEMGEALVSVGTQSDSWVTLAPMLKGRSMCSASAINGLIYVVGGFASTSHPLALATVAFLDPGNDKWTAKQDMPMLAYGRGLCTVGDKLYAFGGATSSGTLSTDFVHIYYPNADSWQNMADMPSPRSSLAVVVVNGKVYAIGGHFARQAQSAVEEYDPTTNKWRVRAPMPTPRGYLSASVVDGKIYAMGGVVDFSNPWGVATVEVYDPASDTWESRRDMPTPRMALVTGAIHDKIYAVGGLNNQIGTAFAVTEEYDPFEDRWTPRADMPISRGYCAAEVMNQRLYVIGGATRGSPSTIVDIVQVYTPPGVPAQVDDASPPLPRKAALHQNYPNPFNPTTMIGFELPAAGTVSLRIYNLLGQEVRVLVDGYRQAGPHAVRWNGSNEAGDAAPSGIYLYQLRWRESVSTRRAIVMR